MTRARQILLFLGACTLAACGDDDGIIIADSGPTVDSGPACGDYAELSDETNDALPPAASGTAEDSGVSFAAGDSKVICGVIDPEQEDGELGVVDLDSFDFEVGENAPLRVVLRSDGADALGGLGVFLQGIDPEGNPVPVAAGGFAAGYALATSATTGAGTWRLVVFALPGEALPTAPIEYELEITDRPACEAATGEPDYTEAKDGARSRRNDVVSATWGQSLMLAPTGVTTDNPEPTEVTFAVDTAVHIVGTSADVAANDSYHDKDTYLVTNGTDANEIDVRLTWPDGDVDMDMMAFVPEAEMLQNIASGGGTFINTNADEEFTLRLPPGVGLWLWVASYNEGATDLPVTYDITVCPRAFTL